MVKREAQVRPFMEQANVEAGLELLGPFGPERVCAFDDARGEAAEARQRGVGPHALGVTTDHGRPRVNRSEEHTSELQSPCNLVCRLLLEKKKKKELNALYDSRVYPFCAGNIYSRLIFAVGTAFLSPTCVLNFLTSRHLLRIFYRTLDVS